MVNIPQIECQPRLSIAALVREGLFRGEERVDLNGGTRS